MKTTTAFILAAVFALCPAAPAHAHRLAPSLLEFIASDTGTIAMKWKISTFRPGGPAIRPRLPEGCKTLGPTGQEHGASSITYRSTLVCDGKLNGKRINVTGLEGSNANVLLQVRTAQGLSFRTILNGSKSSAVVPMEQNSTEVFLAYLMLGLHHISGGFDHLLFVFALVLLIGDFRRLCTTVSAFTAGHSVTLSAAALGWVAAPVDLIEIGIALSIVALAAELERQGKSPGLLSRRPWTMALLFGLLHGFGFAGALRQAGLPASDIPSALLSFNVGIELGQIAFIACVLSLRRAWNSLPWDAGSLPLHYFQAVQRTFPATLPSHAIGSIAAFWTLERVMRMIS